MADEIQKILDIKVKYDDAIAGISRYQQAIEKLKMREKELKQEQENGNITKAQMRKEIEAGRAVAQSYKDEMRVLRKEVQNNIKMENEQVGSLKALRAELSNATKAYDSLSRAERQGAKGKELQNHINQITKELKGAEEETQRYYRNVGNYKNSILQAIGANNGFAGSIMQMASNGGGISGMFTQMGAAVKGFGQALLSLMANPAFLAIAGLAGAGMAVKWFVDYNNAIAEATRLTREFSGLQGDELKGMRNEIQAIADTFGKDFKEVLETSDALVAQYGISWGEATNIIKDGFVSGADYSGNMLNLIKQYAPAFNDAGISASEMVAIIQQTRSGIFSEAGLAMITKAGKSLRNMTDTTAKSLQAVGVNADEMKNKLANGSITMLDAIGQVSEALKGVGANSQEAGEIMDNVFGKQGTANGQQMAQALGELETSLEAVKGTTGEYGEMQERMVETDKELNDVLSSMFDMSENGWETMIGNAKIMVKQWLVAFLKGCVSAYNWLVDWYNESMLLRSIWVSFKNTFSVTWGAIKLVFSNIMDAVKAVGNVLRGLGTIVEGVFTLNWDKVSGGWDTIVKGMAASFKHAAASARSYGKDVADSYMSGINEVMHGKAEHINLDSFSVDAPSSYSGASAGGGGGGSSSSGSGSKSKGKGGKSGKTDAQKEAEKRAKERKDYETKIAKQLQAELDKIAQEGAKKNRDTLAKIYDDQLADLTNKLNAEKDKTSQTYKNLQQLLELKEAEKAKALKAFDDAQVKAEIDKQTKLNTARLAGLDKDEQLSSLGYQLKMQQLQLQEQAELLAVENDEAMKLAIEQKYATLREQAQREFSEARTAEARATAEKEIEINRTKYETIGGLMSSFSDLAETFADKSKAMAVAAKALAIGEILTTQGVAIANAIKTATSSSATWVDMLAAVATVVSTVTAVMGQAMKITKSASFATGGYVSGAGTGTSDSIDAKLSNGESVLTANATSMFSPILSAFNQLGGGVPIVTANPQSRLGEEMIASAVAKGMAMAPAPVVSVQEINSVNSRVGVIERNSTF